MHAPQRPMPQPNFVPVMASTSRSVQSNGMSPGMSRSRDFPLTLSVIIVSPIHCNRELRTLDHTASAEANLLDDGIGRCQWTNPKVVGNTIVQSTRRYASGVIPLLVHHRRVHRRERHAAPHIGQVRPPKAGR